MKMIGCQLSSILFFLLMCKVPNLSGVANKTSPDCPLLCNCQRPSYVLCMGQPDSIIDFRQINDIGPSVLNITHFRLTNLTESICQSSVTELSLSNNSIERIGDLVFSNSRKLCFLDLSRNILAHLSPQAFSGLTHLVRLDLSSNKLIQIDGAFRDLDELQVLNLLDNFLLNISRNTFSNLTNLLRLNLHSNALKVIDESSAFVSLLRLERLDISHNCFNKPFRQLTVFSRFLHHVDLSNACLTHPPDSITSSVGILLLNGNYIRWINDGDLDSFPLLTVLDISSNGLTHIEEDSLGRLLKLHSLNLSHNALENVPKSLPENLRVLDLNGNRLSSILNNTFSSLRSLTELNLKNNVISAFSTCSFCHLHRLERLDLSSNRIRVINRDLLADVSSLNVLVLSNNPIVLIERYSLISLTRCRHLDMSSLHDLLDIDVNILDPLISLETLNVSSSSQLLYAMLNSSRMTDIVARMTSLDVSRNHFINVTEQAVRKIHDGVKHFIRNRTWFVCYNHVTMPDNLCDNNHTTRLSEINMTSSITPPTATSATITNLPSTVKEEQIPEVKVRDIKRDHNSNSQTILAESFKQTNKVQTTQLYGSISTSILLIVVFVVVLFICSVVYVARTPLSKILRANQARRRRNRGSSVDSHEADESCEDSLSVINLRDYDLDNDDEDDLSEMKSRKRTLMDSWSDSRHIHRLLDENSIPNDLFVDLT